MTDMNLPTLKAVRKMYEEMTDHNLKQMYKWFKQQQSMIRNEERRRIKNKEVMKS